MAHTTQINQAAWDNRAAYDLGKIEAFGAADIAEIERKVSVKAFLNYAVLIGGERVGTLVLSVEKDADGVLVLTVPALACRPVYGVKVRKVVESWLQDMAAKIGAGRLRFWTTRDGLAAQFSTLGWRQRYVMEKEIGNEQF